MAFSPGDITKEHILSAVKKIEAEQIELIPSTRWNMVINGKTYPPKEVLRYAHEAMNGEKIWERGGGPPTNTYLERFGFEIKDKQNHTIAIKGFLDKKEDWFQKILESEEFYFQKGHDELKKWLQLEFSDENKNRILKLSSDYKLFQQEAQNDILIKEVLDQINTIVAYCDSHAYKKDEYNKYNDNRILANAGVYQNAWTKKIVEYKFDRKEACNSVYNALDYLNDPKNGCTVLSENHRKMISENFWGIEYNAETFVDDLKNYFSGFNINVNNANNYTYALSCIVYKFQNEWKDEIVGLMASDTTGWQDNHIEQTKDKFSIIWNSKKPTGTDQTLKALRIILEEDGQFFLYYSISNNVEYRARVIDFAEDQNDLTQKNWPAQYRDIQFYQSNFSDYNDGDKKASIVFLIESLEKLNPKPISEFKFYKSQRPRQDNLSPISIDPFENKPEIIFNKNMPLNQILYGPPGTGKTYKLQHDYVDKFTILNKTESKDDFIKNLIINATWWEVIALILLREGNLSVPQINQHPYLRIKHEASNNNNSGTMIWAMLQIHTDPEAPNVHYKNRGEPYIFRKLENSVWQLDVNRCQMDAPQIEELNSKIENFKERQEQSLNYRFTTFHQSYTYEDFIEGIKPNLSEEFTSDQSELGYVIEKGVFYRCCDEACKLAGFVSLKDCLENYSKEQRIEKFKKAQPYALFIDEINRANVSSVLGELITLIEDDKRLSKRNEIIVELPYSKKPFGVPPNLYIIGTMNTADRSVEALDAALRRRFSFEEMPPNPNLVELKYELEGILANELLETINKRLEKLLDKDHLIGHSFFIRINEDDEETTLRKAFYDKIIPLLQEYFYGDYGKIGLVLGKGFVRIKETDKEKIFADFDYNEKEAFSDREVYEIVYNPTRTDLVLALKKLMNLKVEQN